MDFGMDEQRIIAEARDILLLLERGDTTKAATRITQFDAELTGYPVSRFSRDVVALWEQVGIAANNMSNPRYFEDVKDELNRVTFAYSKHHPA